MGGCSSSSPTWRGRFCRGRAANAGRRHLTASGGPALDLSSIVADIASLQPAGFLWLVLLAAIATPITRVIAAAIAFARAGETRMVGAAVASSAVIAISVATALATGRLGRAASLPSPRGPCGARYTATLQGPARSHRSRRSAPHDHRDDGRDTGHDGPSAHPSRPGSLDDLICYFEGDFVPMKDAKVSIMTHAFMYGTATFEGIRAYWNEEQGKLYGLKVREHVERIRQSCRILLMKDIPTCRRAHAADHRHRAPQRLPRRRLHPPVVLQVDQGHRRAAARPRQRALHHHAAVRELHRHRQRRAPHDLVGGAMPTRRCRRAARSSVAT